MTAVVAFLAAEGAVLAADRAVWGPDGRVTTFQSKLIYVENAASVVVGQGIFSQALFRLLIEEARDLADLHKRVVRFMRGNARRVSDDPRWQGVSYDGAMSVYGASWFEGRPVIWGVGADLRPGEALEPLDVGAFRVAPDVDWSAALGREVRTREDVASLSPHDALAIMEAQRLKTDDALGLGPLHLAGGGCDLAVVNGDEICIRTLKMWPDVIGERILP